MGRGAGDLEHGGEGLERGAGDLEHGAGGLERGEGDLERGEGGLARGVGVLGHQVEDIAHRAAEEEGTTRTPKIVTVRKSPVTFPTLTKKWSTTAVGMDGEAVRRGDGLAGEQEDGAPGEGDDSLRARL